MTVTAADPADLAVLGEFEQRLGEAPSDPRAVWRLTARPEQLLPPGDDWRVTYWQGGRGCIAPWTRIWLPLEDRHERVDVLAAAGRPVTVLALADGGPRPAVTDGAPFVKGTADLYAVTTYGGHTVTVTAEHRFLTTQGWKPLADISVGQAIRAGDPPFAAPVYSRVLAIDPAGTGEFYDLTVPGPASYLAEGLWHHNSGKNASCSNALAEWILGDTEGSGEYGIVAPTYADAWTKCVEGKALDLNTYVPTPGGATTMGALRAGDRVLGGDGNPCTVTGVFAVMTGHDCYRVTFKGGAEVIADAAHIWLVEDYLDRAYNRNRLNGFVHGEHRPPYTITTEQMVPNVRYQNGRGNWRNYGVRVAKTSYGDTPVSLPIDPYVLGYWLGDGTSKAGEITTADPEVLDHFTQSGYTIVERPDYGTTGRARTYGIYGLRVQLRLADLLRNKHVPDLYLRAPAADRLALVQGLMDSDGYVSERGQCEFSNKNVGLAQSVVELLCSLGIKASAPRGKVVNGTTYWLVKFTTTEPVFRLKRKLDRLPPRYRDADYWLIESIEPVESVPVRCISVDSPDHTYMVTRHHIATHNTGLLRALGTSMGEIKDHRSATVRGAWRTYGQVLLKNGITVYVDSAAEGGLRVQGRNLKGAWCSEIGLWDKWEMAWKESVVYAVRDGRSQIIVDGTPKASRKARKLIRSFIRNDPEHGGVIIRKLRTRDNIANLSEAFVRAVIGGFRGTRLEKQELEGELLDDVANALWTRDLLDSLVIPGIGQPGAPDYLLKTYIGVDPSDGSEDSDEQAYTVIGKGVPDDHHLYVAECWGGQESPAPFAKRVIRKAVEWNATVIVEKNHGGKWLAEVFRQAQKDMGTHVRVEVVHASDAKRARAEPVAVMYDRISEDGRPLVLHCHRTWKDDEGHLQVDEHMPELEDAMATFTGAAGEKSPDRLDSLVWGASKFLRETWGPPGAPGVRKWASSQALADTVSTEEARGHRKMRDVQERAVKGIEDAPWDLDGFGPQDDSETPARHNNVKQWR
jgi:phage terminase large subunit-like protein